MRSERFTEPCVETPWDKDGKKLLMMDFYVDNEFDIPYELSHLEENEKYWISINWEIQWEEQHKSYRTNGDHGKLLTNLYEYHSLVFSVMFHRENNQWNYMIIDQPQAYKFEMWDGDEKEQETISIEPISVWGEDVTSALEEFSSYIVEIPV